MITKLVGDVHGKFHRYEKLIKDCDASIQVGDFGVGFFYIFGDHRVPMANPPYDSIKKGNHRFIRGNHDNPDVCRRQSYWIPDGTIEDHVLFVGGAHSIDRHIRTEGLDWWADEELNQAQFYEIIAKLNKKITVVVSHTAPKSVIPKLFDSFYKEKFSITEQAFDSIFDIVKPKLWIFGHFHKSADKVIDGTRFICLNELEFIDLDLEEFR